MYNYQFLCTEDHHCNKIDTINGSDDGHNDDGGDDDDGDHARDDDRMMTVVIMVTIIMVTSTVMIDINGGSWYCGPNGDSDQVRNDYNDDTAM